MIIELGVCLGLLYAYGMSVYPTLKEKDDDSWDPLDRSDQQLFLTLTLTLNSGFVSLCQND